MLSHGFLLASTCDIHNSCVKQGQLGWKVESWGHVPCFRMVFYFMLGWDFSVISLLCGDLLEF